MKDEYKSKPDPLTKYIHHLIRRYEGEVALAWSDWTWSDEPLPRDAGLWDEQFALNQDNFKALKAMGRSTVPGTTWAKPGREPKCPPTAGKAGTV